MDANPCRLRRGFLVSPPCLPVSDGRNVVRIRSIAQLWILAVSLLALALMATACGDGGEPSGSTETPQATSDTPSPAPSALFPVTLTDSGGVDVTFAVPPQRIAALAPSFAEILFAIGAGDSVVAVDQNTEYPTEAASLPKLSGFQPSVEGIAAQNPDLVIIQFDPGGLREALETLDIPVLLLPTPTTLDGVFEQMRLLGTASGRPVETDDAIEGMQSVVDGITAKLAEIADGPRVFHELDSVLYSAGPGSFVADLYDLLKADNIATPTGDAFPQMSAEAIIAADPEVIVLADGVFGESAETVAARPGWGSISAVTSGRVQAIDPALTSVPGPRVVQGLEELARILYPELFP
jgi:iron complex transport system substrate-binding protein